ncbi:hypothetical protein BN1723_020560, partial [Verticillium longisporum]
YGCPSTSRQDAYRADRLARWLRWQLRLQGDWQGLR